MGIKHFFFWYKNENKDWIRKTLNKLGRQDLLNVLLPENDKWRKNKPSGDAKHTFDDAIPFNQRKNKAKFKSKKKSLKKRRRSTNMVNKKKHFRLISILSLNNNKSLQK